MKKISYKILIVLLSAFQFSQAQNTKEKQKESFLVQPNVVIDINTRYTNIEIETWDKNEVVVEAFMEVEGEDITPKMRDDLFNKWDFEAVGNSKLVRVHSRSKSRIDIHSFNFDAPNYNHFESDLVDLSLGALDVLDSADFAVPIPPMPELPVPPMPQTPSKFDFKAYKKDKSYLKKWKKKNEKIIGKNAKIKVNGTSLTINNYEYDSIQGKELKERIKEIEKKAQKQLERELKYKALIEKRTQLLVEREKKRAEKLKVIHEKREALQERRRTDIQKILKQRSNIKIKRFIKIKAPKSAKFNMNVRYGELSFSK